MVGYIDHLKKGYDNSLSKVGKLTFSKRASLKVLDKKVKLIFRVDLKKGVIYLTTKKGSRKIPLMEVPLSGRKPFS